MKHINQLNNRLILGLVMMFVFIARIYAQNTIPPSPQPVTDVQALNPVKTVHLICNSHLDPVWLWEWEEGAAEALSTFRIAADFCEQYDGFIFNHNEVVLYQWIEEYDPELFKRIQKLVKEGKWHIMGGWYLQPDCNMPSGESFVRQILLGRFYFKGKFGVTPTTAMNFDPFGHTRGLVQIMAKSGFDSYIFCRPFQEDCSLERDEFIWEGYDGSRIMAIRAYGGYLTYRGKARGKIEKIIKNRTDVYNLCVLWGIGNHGGGPSHVDIRDISKAKDSIKDYTVLHSTPEAYFKDLKKEIYSLPIRKTDLNPWGIGCYTSQIRIKQQHRLLENELFITEKMLTAAWGQGSIEYPHHDLLEATKDLAMSEFHDILPGSSIQPVEESSLQLMSHGLEILSRLKARAFFALTNGQPKAKDGEIPILVYNPHPFPVSTIIECEFPLADQNWDTTFYDVKIFQNDVELPTQVEKELSNLNFDWRKHIAFTATLQPSQMNRFDCRMKLLPEAPEINAKTEDDKIHFKNDVLEVIINTKTGLIDCYRINGENYLDEGACKPLVIKDDANAWGSRVYSFRSIAGEFKLLDEKESAHFSAVNSPTLPAVRVIEDGPVRMVVEAVFGWGNSYIVQQYKLPRQGTEVEVEVRVMWNEKDKMLKLSFPTPDKKSKYIGQVAYGVQELPDTGNEAVAQKWVAVLSSDSSKAFTVINDGVYGSDFANSELRMSLLRSPAYAALNLRSHPLMEYQDRYVPRIDQGERVFHFWLNASPVVQQLTGIDRLALTHNEKPMALSFFPKGDDKKINPFVTLSDDAVQITAIKKAENSNGIIIRLFAPLNKEFKTTVSLPFAGMKKDVTLKPFEIRTYLVDTNTKTWTEVDLMENPVK